MATPLPASATPAAVPSTQASLRGSRHPLDSMRSSRKSAIGLVPGNTCEHPKGCGAMAATFRGVRPYMHTWG